MSHHPWSGLRRDTDDAWIAGVCAGIARHFEWNVKLVRALVVLGAIFTSAMPFIIGYAVLWYALDPQEGGPSGDERLGGEPRGERRRWSSAALRSRLETLDRRLRRVEACVTDGELELRREIERLERE